MNTTSTILEQLYKIFDNLNEHYFENKLPRAFIVITPEKSKTKAVYGTFSPESWAKGEEVVDEYGDKHVNIEESYHEISISSEYLARPLDQLCSTMCHEMVHMFCNINEIDDTSNGGVYHNKRFKSEAEKRGLIIDKNNVIGWSITSPTTEFTNFVNSIDLDKSVFEFFRNTKLAVSSPTPKKRYVCPVCGLEVQAKKGKNIICGDCDKRMDYWDLTDPDNPKILEDYNNGLWEEREDEE